MGIFYSIIEESLDSPFEWKWDNVNIKGITTAIFYADTRISTVFLIRLPDNSVNIAFIVDRESHITGKGLASRIFATVIDIIKGYLELTDTRHFSFYAKRDEPSRIKMYRTLVRKLTALGFTAEEKTTSAGELGYEEGTQRFDLYKN